MFNTIRTKMLFGFGLLLIVLLTILGAFLFTQVRDTVVPLTHELSQEVLRARSDGLGHLFRGYLNDVRTLSRDAVMRSGDLDSIQRELLRRQADNNPDYEMVFFADVQGNYVSATGSTGNVADRGYFRAIMQEGRDEVIGEPLTSRASGAKVFVIASAVVDEQDQRIGLLAATVLLGSLTEIAGAIDIGGHGFGWVMDRQGLLIAHPSDNLRMKLNLMTSADQGFQGLDQIAQTLVRGESGMGSYQRPDGTVYYTLFTPIPHTPNWGLGVSVQESTLMARAYGLMRTILWSMLGVMVLVLLLVFVMSGRIAAPLLQLMQGVDFVSSGHLGHKLDIRTGDEIQRLALAFNRMTDDLQEQMRELAVVTAEKARVDGELRVGRDIQMSFLKKLFPAFPNRSEFSLYASLVPAKEVGGDLYDFTLLDDDHLLFYIGDVSDKGVPASLIMSMTMTLMKRAGHEPGISPAGILRQVNEGLSEDNESAMFVTLFIGSLNFKTGELVFSNAGHNPPLILKSDGRCSFLALPDCLVLGVMAEAEYRDDSYLLERGDMIVTYTDGVTEAMNLQRELYSEKRLKETLASAVESNVVDAVEGIISSVRTHAMGAPQSDDIAVLAVKLS